jgi:hypothetical protein
MISHCANPNCRIPFHYLRGGRLYRFDIKSPSPPCNDVPNAICSLKPSSAAVFFWLCDHCLANYSLRFNYQEGVTLVSHPSSQLLTMDAPVVAVGQPFAELQVTEHT